MAIVMIATLECAIGLLLIVGRGLRLAVYLLFGELLGILSPVVLLSGRLFAGPNGAPTLEGQYVLKDVILVAAAMVVTAGSFRGGRLVRAAHWVGPGREQEAAEHRADARRRLEAVLSAAGGARSVDEVCREHEISLATYQGWQEAALDAATNALVEDSRTGGG